MHIQDYTRAQKRPKKTLNFQHWLISWLSASSNEREVLNGLAKCLKITRFWPNQKRYKRWGEVFFFFLFSVLFLFLFFKFFEFREILVKTLEEHKLNLHQPRTTNPGEERDYLSELLHYIIQMSGFQQDKNPQNIQRKSVAYSNEQNKLTETILKKPRHWLLDKVF